VRDRLFSFSTAHFHVLLGHEMHEKQTRMAFHVDMLAFRANHIPERP
jgi:hypothetical protein